MFPIGVFAQPNGSAAKWKARGINTLITNSPKPDHLNLPRELYADEWVHQGVQVFMGPDNFNPKTDPALPSITGFLQPDEPDLMPHLLRKPDGAYDVRGSVDRYCAAYSALKTALPTYPVLGNFTGPDLAGVGENATGTNPRCAQDYKDFFTGADILSADWYLANNGYNFAHLTVTVGKMIDRLKAWGLGKPVWACIECSNQKVRDNSRCPTPAEFRAQVWQCILRGATGIWYFPYEMPGHGGTFKWDAVPPEIVSAMTETNALIQRFAPYFLKGLRYPLDDFGQDPLEGWGWTLNGRHLQMTLDKRSLKMEWTESDPPKPAERPREVRLTYADGTEAVFVPK